VSALVLQQCDDDDPEGAPAVQQQADTGIPTSNPSWMIRTASAHEASGRRIRVIDPALIVAL